MIWILLGILFLFLFFTIKPKKKSYFVTVVIPTLQRLVLRNALLSLVKQENQDFFVVVVNDSDKPFDHSLVPKELQGKLQVIQHQSKGWPSPARNEALKFIEKNIDTTWIAFLDDDDIWHEKYVTWLKDAEKFNSDLVVFRAAGSFDHLPLTVYIPFKEVNKLRMGQFTIAFAVKKSSMIYFREERIQIRKGEKGNLLIAEDFFYLKDALEAKKKIIISPHVAYGVRRMIDKSIDQNEAMYTELSL
jgi:glycosyltransferase involved in cell wall biosynthesis